MAKWLRSPEGLVTLSYVALISLLVRSYVDTRFILVEDFSDLGESFVAVWIAGFTVIIGGWIWALIAFEMGSRKSVAWLLVFALVTALGFGAGSLLSFVSFPIEIAVFGASLIAGSLAAISAFLQI